MTIRPTTHSRDWAHAPERSNMLMLRLMTWFSLRVGRTAARGVLHPIVLYFVWFGRASRHASRDYLRRVLGRPASWRELYRHVFTFASTILDRVFLLNRRFELFEFEVHGADTFLERVSGGDGLFLVGAHLGSFEAVRTLGWKNTNLRIAMVMHEENAQKINATLAAVNPEATQNIIGLGRVDSMLQVREHLDAGWVVGMLADRTPGNESVRAVQLLGTETDLPVGPFRMAAFLRRPVLFMTALYLGGNRYSIHFDPLADFTSVTAEQRSGAITEAITRYAELLERYCRMAPYNWFNFFDFWQTATDSAARKAS